MDEFFTIPADPADNLDRNLEGDLPSYASMSFPSSPQERIAILARLSSSNPLNEDHPTGGSTAAYCVIA
ncbi:hypothetical protein C8Q79DRAFT_30390 [Trametes meyenii]|nr:hypothetical protein C8Q79DRAFT_30390 [Trametes meyenii]